MHRRRRTCGRFASLRGLSNASSKTGRLTPIMNTEFTSKRKRIARRKFRMKCLVRSDLKSHPTGRHQYQAAGALGASLRVTLQRRRCNGMDMTDRAHYSNM